MRTLSFVQKAGLFALLAAFFTPLYAKSLDDYLTEIEIHDLHRQKFPLHYAVRQEDVKAVNKLIAKGADVNARFFGETPLHWAIRDSNVEMAALLIAKGADVNARARNGEGWTPPYLAQKSIRGIEIMILLIKNGVDDNVKDFFKNNYPKKQIYSHEHINRVTYLHTTVGFGNVELTEELLALGFDVNVKDYNGETPLHWAVRNKNVKLITLLLRYGANPNAKDDIAGTTPFELARMRGDDGNSIDFEILEILFNKEIYSLIRKNSFKIRFNDIKKDSLSLCRQTFSSVKNRIKNLIIYPIY